MTDHLYDDGAVYGPDPDAETAAEQHTDRIYDDGAPYGNETS